MATGLAELTLHAVMYDAGTAEGDALHGLHRSRPDPQESIKKVEKRRRGTNYRCSIIVGTLQAE